MRDEYDFSKGQRGKFYTAEQQHLVPLYLEPDVLDYFSARAKAAGIELSAMINDQLKKDIQKIERR
ncbi:hypothetical protein FV139_05780 [Parahaliea maris]|uniref:Toxin-antitoxin system, antitoxin component n=1 Tax=Parahaliea maris TaxID=2716870 RepID=A0A5C9A3E4_9GAMM|nr:hypothetical protein [Parahaliea maris]TXS95395.1 hypothetical protein FV139_05780 [Parahaliea maris]